MVSALTPFDARIETVLFLVEWQMFGEDYQIAIVTTIIVESTE